MMKDKKHIKSSVYYTPEFFNLELLHKLGEIRIRSRDGEEKKSAAKCRKDDMERKDCKKTMKILHCTASIFRVFILVNMILNAKRFKNVLISFSNHFQKHALQSADNQAKLSFLINKDINKNNFYINKNKNTSIEKIRKQVSFFDDNDNFLSKNYFLCKEINYLLRCRNCDISPGTTGILLRNTAPPGNKCTAYAQNSRTHHESVYG